MLGFVSMDHSIVGVTAPKLLEALHARSSPKIDASRK